MAERHVISIEVAANTAQAQAGIQSLSRATSGLDSLVGKLTIGGLFGTTIAGAIGKFVANSTEAQESSVNLSHAIERLGGQAGVTESQINSLAAGIQDVSKFTDESVKDAASALLLFDRVTGDTFERTLKVSADLAAVMKTDIPQAAAQLGRALQLPGEGLRVLNQVGIKFTDDQVKLLQAMTETGHVAEAQGIILSELERRTKGAAAATRDSLGGAITGLVNQVGDLLEVESGVSSVTEAVNKLADGLERTRDSDFGARLKTGITIALVPLKEAASVALTLAKIIADPIGAVRGTGLFAPDAAAQYRGHRGSDKTAATDPFAGASAQAIADAQAKIDQSKNAASEKSLAESLARQKQQRDEWEEDMLRQGARAAQEERDAWIDAARESANEYADLTADIQKITDDFAQETETSIAKLTDGIGGDLAKGLEGIRNPLTDFTVDFKENLYDLARTGRLTFDGLVDSMVNALLQRRLYDAIDKMGDALIDALSVGKKGGFLGSVTGFLGGLFGGGGKAGGGIIDRPTVVGESGPEIAFPGRGGASIVNMSQLAYAGGGSQQAAPVINYQPQYSISGVETQQIIGYIETTRERDQKGMLKMLYDNGFGRMR